MLTQPQWWATSRYHLPRAWRWDSLIFQIVCLSRNGSEWRRACSAPAMELLLQDWVKVFQSLLLLSSGKRLWTPGRRTLIPHTSSGSLRARFSLSFIETEKTGWYSNKVALSWRFTHCKKLFSSKDSTLFSTEGPWILRVLWVRTANKCHSLLISPTSYVEEKDIPWWWPIFQVSQMRFSWWSPIRRSSRWNKKIANNKKQKIFSESTK